MNKKVLFIVLALAASIAVASVVPAFAKNIPEGVKMDYYTGGQANMARPTGFPFSVSNLRIMVMETEAATYGTGDSIVLFILFMGDWYPIAHFTTNPNPELLAFIKTLWGNTPAGLKNTIWVSEDELKVDRHGNRITASLTEQVIQKQVGGVWGPVTISAFTMELNKVGGSIHTDYSVTTPTYTINLDIMGFNGNGVFTYGGVDYEMTDEVIVMHRINTYVPTS